MVEWWSGGVVEWWSGGVVECGVVEWWSGGVVELELELELECWGVQNGVLGTPPCCCHLKYLTNGVPRSGKGTQSAF